MLGGRAVAGHDRAVGVPKCGDRMKLIRPRFGLKTLLASVTVVACLLAVAVSVRVRNVDIRRPHWKEDGIWFYYDSLVGHEDSVLTSDQTVRFLCVIPAEDGVRGNASYGDEKWKEWVDQCHAYGALCWHAVDQLPAGRGVPVYVSDGSGVRLLGILSEAKEINSLNSLIREDARRDKLRYFFRREDRSAGASRHTTTVEEVAH